jgi:hypothetical protein
LGSEIVGAAVDAIRSRRELVIENMEKAVLHHKVNVSDPQESRLSPSKETNVD